MELPEAGETLRGSLYAPPLRTITPLSQPLQHLLEIIKGREPNGMTKDIHLERADRSVHPTLMLHSQNGMREYGARERE